MELVGIFASIFELMGILLITKKNKYGFLSFILGNILWIIYSVVTGNAIGLIFVCSVAFFLNIRGYKMWGKNGK